MRARYRGSRRSRGGGRGRRRDRSRRRGWGGCSSSSALARRRLGRRPCRRAGFSLHAHNDPGAAVALNFLHHLFDIGARRNGDRDHKKDREAAGKRCEEIANNCGHDGHGLTNTNARSGAAVARSTYRDRWPPQAGRSRVFGADYGYSAWACPWLLHDPQWSS